MESLKHSLWVEKYRPNELDNYIGNDHLKSKVSVYLESGDIPHLLLFGRAGTGKTTLAKLLINNIDCDYLYINASDENSVDVVREKVKNFASTLGFKDMKVIILDECDYITPNAQAALRNLMETFSKSTRFILTCNYVEKIIDPIQSRCQTFAITPPSKKDVAKRLNDILKEMVNGIKDALESTPPELSADLVDMGLTLTGGGALLKNIDKRFSKETGLPVHIADDPLSCVAVGTGKALDQEQTFSTMLTEY